MLVTGEYLGFPDDYRRKYLLYVEGPNVVLSHVGIDSRPRASGVDDLDVHERRVILLPLEGRHLKDDEFFQISRRRQAGDTEEGLDVVAIGSPCGVAIARDRSEASVTAGDTSSGQCNPLSPLVDDLGAYMQIQLRTVSLVSALFVFIIGCQVESRQPTGAIDDRPNIVLILLDDVGYDDLAVFGSGDIQTPHIDRLANRGMRFSHFYTSSVCSPTRASLLTGRYPQAYGIRRSLGHFKTSRGIPIDSPFVAEVLQRQGYRTIHIGKWHVGLGKTEYWGINRGFESTVTYVHPDKSKRYQDPAIIHDFDFQKPIIHQGHQTEILTDFAIDFLENQSASRHRKRDREPFFLNLWYQAAHSPNEPPARWAARYQGLPAPRALFAAVVSHVDEQIGRLLRALDETGLSADTLVVIASDNGTSRKPTNSSMRGYKGTLFEGGIRSPLVIRWPGRISSNSITNAVIRDLDLLPTFADLARADVSDLRLDGHSFVHVLVGDDSEPRATPLFWENKFSNRRFESPSGLLNSYAVRSGEWKLVFEEVDSRLAPALFNLAEDPGERVDLADLRPDIVSDLLGRYWAWRRQVGLIPWKAAGPNTARGAQQHGQTLESAEVVRFDKPSAIRLRRDARFDFNDGDFSLAARIKWSPVAGPQGSAPAASVIATKPGSWSLMTNAVGLLALEIVGADGRTSTLTSRSRLLPETYQHIAFTVYGFRLDSSIVSLYIDHELEAESRSVAAVSSNDSEIILGNSADDSAPFLGVIQNLRFWVSCLAPHELKALEVEDKVEGK